MEVGLREEIACRGKSIYAIKLILYGETNELKYLISH